MSFSFGFDLPEGTENEGSGVTHEQPDADRRRGEKSREEQWHAPGGVSAAKESSSGLLSIDVCAHIESFSRRELRYDTIPLQAHPSESTPLKSSLEPLKKILLSPSSISTRKEGKDSSGASSGEERTAKSLIESKNTDIIGGVYEGGLKVWECSIDLCKYLAEQISRFRNTPSHGCDADAVWNDCKGALSEDSSILELGCGHGLPLCLVYRESMMERKLRKRTEVSGGPTVLFSDYNEFVLRDVTLPNVFLNMAEELNGEDTDKAPQSDQIFKGVSMVSGDWMELSSQLKRGHIGDDSENVSSTNAVSAHTGKSPCPGRFDLILAAETTYTYESTRDTAKLLARHLKYETGVGLIATKRYYFGVGGGADAFREVANESFLEEEGCWDCLDATKRRLRVETIRDYDNGSGNIRELLRVRLTKST